MELAVLNIDGQETGKKVKLTDSVFAIEPNDHAIYLDIKLIRANQRQGTHKAKERGDVTGSTKKIKKQKGTGTARAGSKKSPLFRSGGRVFGPKPRNYGFKLNKKVRGLARRSALSYKAKSNCILILEDFNFDTPKTSEYSKMLRNLELNGRKSLLVIGADDRNLYLSSRNIQGAKVILANELNTYDVLNANKVILSESAVDVVDNMFK